MTEIVILLEQNGAGQRLIDAALERQANGACDFTLLMPLAPVRMNTRQGTVIMSVGVPRSSDEVTDYARAARRLDDAIEAFRVYGVQTCGEIGDPRPMRAIETYLKNHEPDEIIVPVVDHPVARLLHQDLPTRLQRRFHIPVTKIPAQPTRRPAP